MTRKLLIAAAVLLVGASLAGATTLLKMDFSDLARDANYIVVGTVTDVHGEWDDSLTFIHSRVTLDVERSLRGHAPDTLEIVTPGGVIGSFGQVAEGVATFEPGERVLVFLTTWEDGTAKVLGYAQGKSRVVKDFEGRQRLQGGVANGRTVDAVSQELHHGPNHNIPLRPAS